MKRSILSVCLAATLVLGSCSDWLNVQPSTQQDRESLLSSENGYAEALAGVYTQMASADLYGRNLTWGILDIFGRVYTDRIIGAESWLRLAHQYGYALGSPMYNSQLAEMVESYWSDLYNAIAGLNSILVKIDEDKSIFTGDHYSIIKGEAIGLRAFLHFEVLRLFGDIYERCRDEKVMPFVTELTHMVAPELTGEQMVTILLSELETAMELLENDPMLLGTAPDAILASLDGITADSPITGIYLWHNRRFQFNYFAAKATIARIHMWKGDKPAALAAALDVIDYQEARFPWVKQAAATNIGSTSNVTQDRTFATEHIFALNITNMDDLIKGFQNRLEPTKNNMMYTDVTMFPNNETATDIRYSKLIIIDSERPANPVPAYTGKYQQVLAVRSWYKERLPLIRISEMYYIAAECAPTWQEGLVYLNAVRTARFVGHMALPVSDEASLRTAIMNEYRKEFIGEGQVWHYLKRHQIAAVPNPPMSPPFNVAYYQFPRPESEDIYGKRE